MECVSNRCFYHHYSTALFILTTLFSTAFTRTRKCNVNSSQTHLQTCDCLLVCFFCQRCFSETFVQPQVSESKESSSSSLWFLAAGEETKLFFTYERYCLKTLQEDLHFDILCPWPPNHDKKPADKDTTFECVPYSKLRFLSSILAITSRSSLAFSSLKQKDRTLTDDDENRLDRNSTSSFSDLYTDEASWAARGTSLEKRSGPMVLGSVVETGRGFTREAPTQKRSNHQNAIKGLQEWLENFHKT